MFNLQVITVYVLDFWELSVSSCSTTDSTCFQLVQIVHLFSAGSYHHPHPPRQREVPVCGHHFWKI